MRGIQYFIIFFLLTSLVSANIYQDAEAISQEVRDFIGTGDSAVIIRGDHTTPSERMALDYLRESYSSIAEVPVIKESTPTDKTKIILLGGPTHNGIASKIVGQSGFNVTQNNLTVGSVTFYDSEHTDYIIFSDYTGYNNLPRTNVRNSPLSRFIPEKYVPIVASVLSLLFLWLGKLLFNLLTKVFKWKLAEKVMKKVKKKALKEKFIGTHILGVRIKLREWISIILSATVFALAISYSYFTKSDIFNLIMITVLVNSLVYAIRHFVRLFLDRHHGLHTEYVLWYWGAIITILSGWLGNAFALAGYMVKDEKHKDEKDGQVALIVNLITFAAFIAFAVANLLNPSIVMQMTMILAMNIAFLQMLPLTPFSGKRIYAWKPWVWTVCFIPMLAAYIWTSLLV